MIDCSRRRVFTIDIVRQLAELMEVDNVGDEEIEDVVTSLTPVNHSIIIYRGTGWLIDIQSISCSIWLTVTGRSHGTSRAGRSQCHHRPCGPCCWTTHGWTCRSGRSCRSSPSLHYRTPPAQGWSGQPGLQGRPSSFHPPSASSLRWMDVWVYWEFEVEGRNLQWSRRRQSRW